MSSDARRVAAPTGTVTLRDGRSLAWDEHGSSDGPPVLYMHGSPACRVGPSGLGPTAVGAGVRLIVADRPGCGMSTFQPGRRITDWPTDVAALADHLELEQYRIVGVSGGGPYALACAAAKDPRLVRVAVSVGVGRLDTPQAIADLHDTNRPILEAAAQGTEKVTPLVEKLADRGTLDESTLATMVADMPPEDRAMCRDRPQLLPEILDITPAVVNGYEGVAYDLSLVAQPWDFDLGTITCPVDFHAARHDRNVPLHHIADQARAVPHSTMTVWSEAGHMAAHTRLSEVLQKLLNS